MKLTNLFKNSIISSLLISLIFTQDVTLSFGEMSDGTLEIYMDNAAPVAGFQFNVSGLTLTGGSGGSAQSAGFMVTTSSTTAIGFSLMGTNGLGKTLVKGSIRVPLPPAIITTGTFNFCLLTFFLFFKISSQ